MKKVVFLIMILSFIGVDNKPALSSPKKLPDDFIDAISKIYKIAPEFSLSAGGGKNNNHLFITHYPVIMIAGNKRSFYDWLGKNPGNAKGNISVYKNFIKTGFSPQELWLYQYTEEGKEMKNIEELTDGLKWFIYSVLFYTKSTKAQILAHGEGAVLAQATIKKYNLYNLVHAVVYIAGPFHGSAEYTYTKALLGSPVCSNLAIDSDFIQDIILPDETPYNVFENENENNIGVKYMTVYNNLPFGNSLFSYNPASPSLLGALNYELDYFSYDGLRCSEENSKLFISFLSDPAIKYNSSYDKDKDGFISNESGGVDYNDNDASIFPGASEIPEDNIDQDCNNMDLLLGMGKDCLVPIKKKPL